MIERSDFTFGLRGLAYTFEKIAETRGMIMSEKPTYEELEKRVRELERAEAVRKRADEKTARASEDILRMLVENVKQAIYIMPSDYSEIAYANPAAEELYGVAVDELYENPMRWSKYIHPDDLKKIASDLEEQKGDAIQDFQTQEFRVNHPTRGELWIKSNIYPVKNRDGYLVGISSDITGRKRAEEALRGSEEKFRSMMEAMSDETYICSSDFRVQYMNPAMIEMVGHDAAGELCHEALYGRSKQCAWCIHGKIMEGERVNYEFENPGNNETYHISNSPIFNTDGSISKLSIFRNVSETKKAEEVARVESERSSKYLDIVDVMIIALDRDANLTLINDAGCRISGYTQEEIIGKNWIKTISPRDKAGQVLQAYKNIMDGDIELWSHAEDSFITKNGAEIVVIWRNSLLLDDQGNITGMLCSADDITERKRAEDAVWESNERFQKVFDSQLDAIFVLNAGAPPHVLLCNKAASVIFGYEHDEMTGDITGKLHVDKSHLKVFQERLYSTIEKEGVLRDFEFSMRRKNGEVFPSEHIVLQLKNDVGKRIGWVSIVRDLTERKRTENRLRRLQKMEAIGQLAGGVAHDLNNVLSGIVSYPEILIEEIKEWRESDYSLITQLMILEGFIGTDLARNPEGVKQFVQGMKQEAEEENRYKTAKLSGFSETIIAMRNSGQKAADIVQDLLTLARRGVSAMKVVYLNDIVSKYLDSPEHQKLLSNHPDVGIETGLEEKTLNVLGSPTHISKSIMNLVYNAAEAMPNGGRICISLENRYIDGEARDVAKVKEGDYVVLRVSDDGIGISPEDQKRIFEPFYTKKTMGRSGTGLGMAVVWGTVADHNGHIDIQSTVGEGTTFSLYFPVTRKEVKGDESDFSADDYRGNGERILVVDDVLAQRDIASTMLRKLGYEVSTAASGEEAVDYLKTKSADLIVLDMIMDPGMDGCKTYEEIIKLHPGQKAIIASGFSNSDRVKKARALGAGEYIKKPYTWRKIAFAVKEELRK